MIIQNYINIFNILEALQKMRAVYFAVFVLIIMILETFSLGMFYPFLQSITNNDVNSKLIMNQSSRPDPKEVTLNDRIQKHAESMYQYVEYAQ